MSVDARCEHGIARGCEVRWDDVWQSVVYGDDWTGERGAMAG
jgi:hypothetical protein